MRTVWLAILLTLTVTACTSTADRRAVDEERCRSYGFRTGTEAFSRCLLDVDLNRDADRRAAFSRSFGGYGYGGYGVGYGFGARRFGW